MAEFWVKRNDVGGTISTTLSDATGPVDLTGATVAFHLGRAGQPALVSAAATVTNAAGGVVSYTWAAGDTDTEGDWQAEWEVTFPSGEVRTFPNDGYDTVHIRADLA
ncbi:MAG TPA: BppU family phage baseplate upper protein [Longimicrobiales bacterium]